MSSELYHINWETFHFLRPIFLWLLIPAFLSLVLGLISVREQIKWKKFIAPHLRPFVIKKGSEAKKRWLHIFLFLFLAVAILGASGPVWEEIEVPGKKLETPVVIALDLSQSMMADDIQPSRLERAKFKILDLLEANPGARVALIGFAGSAHTIVPLSHDYKIIRSHLEGLLPRIMPIQGTDLESALILADTLFSVTNAPGTLILITDDFDDNTFDLLQKQATGSTTKFEIIPVNTPGGATVPAFWGRGTLKGPDKKPVHSKLNTPVLQKLNSLGNVNVNQLTLDNSDMEQLAKTISASLEFTDADEKKEDDWQDNGILLAIPLALLTLLWFRKGLVLYSILIVFTLTGCQSGEFRNLWFTPDYQAQQLYNEGKFLEAAETYKDPLHKGVAYFKAGNYEAAIAAFEEDTTAMGAYNLGLAHYKNGDFVSAEMAFVEAVELNPDFGDAKKNQQLMEQLSAGENEANPEDAQEVPQGEQAENIQNKDQEDLGGGGQDATKEQMQEKRKEETVATDVRKGKELDEVPEDFEAGQADNTQKVLMRKVDDDPALFLKKKFAYQVKKNGIKPKNKNVIW
ncbi:MAG: VWA domain-containing protein [Bacteroidota bacterium]